MHSIIDGAVAMGFFVATLFFLRFYRRTKDRLFGLFGLAFAVMSVNRIALANATDDNGDLYWVRLLAFVIILFAMVDKNRKSGGQSADARPPQSVS